MSQETWRCFGEPTRPGMSRPLVLRTDLGPLGRWSIALGAGPRAATRSLGGRRFSETSRAFELELTDESGIDDLITVAADGRPIEGQRQWRGTSRTGGVYGLRAARRHRSGHYGCRAPPSKPWGCGSRASDGDTGRAMSQDNVEVVRRVLEAFLAGVERGDMGAAFNSGALVDDARVDTGSRGTWTSELSRTGWLLLSSCACGPRTSTIGRSRSNV